MMRHRHLPRSGPTRWVARLMVGMLVLVGLPVIWSAGVAQAYNLLPCKWNHSTVKVYDLSANTFWTAIQSGMASWNSSVSPAQFNTVISAQDLSVSGGTYGNTGWSGLTASNGSTSSGPSCSSGYWVTGGMRIYLNTTTTAGYTAAQLESVAAHELGHAYGLDHNNTTLSCSGHPGALYLMYFSDIRVFSNPCGNISTPQSDDKNGVNHLY